MVQKTVKRKHRKVGHHVRKRIAGRAKKASRAKLRRHRR
jgi:hypothetical protein